MDKSYFIECVTDELNRKGIQDLKDATIDDVASIASEFFGMIEVRGHVFCSIDGYLQNIYGCMLDKWLKESKKYKVAKCSDVPELVSMQKEIDEFLDYTKRFLGFEYADGSFKELAKSVKSV